MKRALRHITMFAGGVFLAACGADSTPVKTASKSCLDPAAIPERVSIPAGEFNMGSVDFYRDEGPVRAVSVGAFDILSHEVTNAEFGEFTKAAGYVTRAERTPNPADHPDIPADKLVAGSAVFISPLQRKRAGWWEFRAGANWRAPFGPHDSPALNPNAPAVHIAYEDALAYAVWRGGDLPTEAEWEYAARGGLDGARYAWGDVSPEDDPSLANSWQGAFPIQNTAQDGFEGIAPVGCYPPNGYGLYDVTGNVWEWTKDSDRAANRGLIKGGSFLCAPNYCARYRPAAKQAQELDFSANHIGFRIVFRDDSTGG